MNEEWTPVDVNLFKQCQQDLKYNELIASENFDSKDAMNGLDISNSRLDGFVFGIGHSTLKELQASGFIYRDADLNEEELSGICGKFLELQISRFNGISPISNVLQSVYFDSIDSIQHPILKYMFKVFSHVQFLVEQFIMKNRSIRTNSWILFPEYDSFFKYSKDLEFEFETIKENQTIPEDISEVLKFELSLINRFKDPFNGMLYLPKKFPTKDNLIGIDEYHSYTHCSPGSPPKALLIPTIDKIPSEIQCFVEDINAFPTFLRKDISLYNLLENIIEWNEKCPHYLLTYSFAARYLIPDPVWDDYFIQSSQNSKPSEISKQDSKPSENSESNEKPTGEINGFFTEEYLKNQLSSLNLNPAFFKCPFYQKYNVDQIFKDEMYIISRIFLHPLSSLPNYFQGKTAHSWESIQKTLYGTFNECKECQITFKCDEALKAVFSLSIPIWTTQIAGLLMYTCTRLSLECDIFDDRIINMVWYLFEFSMSSLIHSFQEKRVFNAAIKVLEEKRKRKKHDSKITISRPELKPYISSPPAEELRAIAMKQVFIGLESMYSYFSALNAIHFSKPKGPFFNEKKAYEMVISCAQYMVHL